MANRYRWKLGTLTTGISTGLNSLANQGDVTTSEIDNSTGAWDGAFMELYIGFTVEPSNYKQIYVSVAKRLDGTNSEDGGLQSFENLYTVPLPAQSSVVGSKRISTGFVPFPPCKFVITLENGSGQTTAASGNTLKYQPVAREIVTE